MKGNQMKDETVRASLFDARQSKRVLEQLRDDVEVANQVPAKDANAGRMRPWLMISEVEALLVRVEKGESLALLVSDALAFTPELTERQRELLVSALRQIALGEVGEGHEEAWFTLMLDAGMQTTASFDPEATRV